MKKRLLSMFAAALCTCGLYAYNVGDYWYSESARWRIVGDNIIENGDLSKGLDGLVNDANDPLTTDYFTLVAGEGPGGLNCLEAVEPGALGTGGALYFSYPLTDAGYYLVTYKVRSKDAEHTTQTANTGSNCQSAFLNAGGGTTVDTGAGDSWVIPSIGGFHYGSEWKEFAFTTFVSAGEPKFINFLMCNLIAGDRIADFGVYRIQEVGDDRIATNLLARIDECLDNEADFPKYRELITQARESLAEMMQQPDLFENPDNVKDLVKSIEEEAFNPFLDSNTVDMSGYFQNFNFDSSMSGWQNSGGRWSQTSGADEALNLNSGYVYQDYQQGYDLGVGDVWQEVDLPAGRYMYRVKAAGNYHYRVSSSDKRGVVMGDSVQGMSFFLNADTLVMEHVSPTWAKEYTLYTTVNDGEKVRIGVHSPGSTGKRGGRFKYDNIELRLIGGKTIDDVNKYFYGVKVAQAQEGLKEMTDSAQRELDSQRYLYGKDNLSKGIQDGLDVLAKYTDYTEEVYDTLVAQRAVVADSLKSYVKVNAEYTALGDAIADADAAYADESRPNGKADLKTAIDAARSYYSSLTAAVRDSAGMVAQKTALGEAMNVFYIANATYNTPGELQLVNPYFADGGTGWEVTLDSDSKQVLKFGSNETFTNGTVAYAARNSNSGPANKIVQTVTLSNNGLYELEFEAYAYGKNKDGAITDNVKVWFVTQLGDGRIDSMFIHTSKDNGNVAVPYKARVLVENAPVDLTFGIDALNNVDVYDKDIYVGDPYATDYGYGGNRLKYYGPYDKYLADSVAAAIQPARDSLQAAIDTTKAIRYRNTKNVDVTPFTSAISAAQAVHDNANATIDDIMAQFPALEKAARDLKVSGVWPAEGEYFDLTFMLENADFTDAENMLAGWNMTGDAIDGFVAPGYVTKQFQADDTFTSRMTQTVTGLPEGKYQFVAGASYRCKGQPSTFNPADYETNTFVYLIANEDSVPVKGLLAEGEDGGVDANGDKQWNLGDMMLPMWDFRRTPNVALFEANHYRSAVEFELSGTDKATVGISSQGLTKNSWFGFYMPRIHFWGDVVADGIDNVTEDAGVSGGVSGDVYTLSGVKVRSNATSLDGLAKGIYIMNGKKYVVR